MARNMRKQNLKIQMLAGNSLKSFQDGSSQKTMTLVSFYIVTTYKRTNQEESIVF